MTSAKEISVEEYFCKGQPAARRVEDPAVKPPNRRGLNPRNYVKSPSFHEPKLLSDLKFDEITRWREGTLKSKLNSWLDLRPGEWYAGETLRPLLAEENFYTNLTQQIGEISRLIVLYNHEAYVDCEAKTYNYIVSFWVPKNPLLVFRGVPQLLETHIASRLTKRLEKLKQGDQVVIINTLDDVIIPLLQDLQLREQLRELIARSQYDRLIRYLDRGTRAFLESVLGSVPSAFPFGTGEYWLSGEMAYTLEVIVKIFLKFRDVNRDYQIITKGFADSQPLKGYIRYDGGADLALNKDEIAPLRVSARFTKLSSNLELSVARGYSGAQLISERIRAGIRGDEESRHVAVYYSGGGEIPGAVRDKFRRIDIIISRVSR